MAKNSQSIEWLLLSPHAFPSTSSSGQYIHRLGNALACSEASPQVLVARPAAQSQPESKFITKAEYTTYDHLNTWEDQTFDALDRHLADQTVKLLFPYAPNFFGKFWNHALERFIQKRKSKGDQIYAIYYDGESFEENSMLKFQYWKNRVARFVEQSKLKKILSFSDRIFLLSMSQYSALDHLIPPKTPVLSLPVPSNLSLVVPKHRADNIRRAFAKNWPYVIGTYGSFKETTLNSHIEQIVRELFSRNHDILWIFMGRNSEAFVTSLRKKIPEATLRVQTTGELDEAGISAHIQSCDLLVQPYPDGVSTLRTSVMAGLHHGVTVITSEGRNTEQIWRNSQAVGLIPWPSVNKSADEIVTLLKNKSLRQDLAEKGKKLYDNRFSLEKLASILMESV